MYNHTTIRHSYDFSHQIHEMAVETIHPDHDERDLRETSRREQAGQQKTGLLKVLKNIRETFYRS